MTDRKTKALVSALETARDLLATFGSAGIDHTDKATGKPLTPAMMQIVAALKLAGEG